MSLHSVEVQQLLVLYALAVCQTQQRLRAASQHRAVTGMTVRYYRQTIPTPVTTNNDSTGGDKDINLNSLKDAATVSSSTVIAFGTTTSGGYYHSHIFGTRFQILRKFCIPYRRGKVSSCLAPTAYLHQSTTGSSKEEESPSTADSSRARGDRIPSSSRRCTSRDPLREG